MKNKGAVGSKRGRRGAEGRDSAAEGRDSAAERGVEVRVVLNAETRAEHTGSEWTRLVNAGGRIRYKQTNGEMFQLMHHKLAIIDEALSVADSYVTAGRRHRPERRAPPPESGKLSP